MEAVQDASVNFVDVVDVVYVVDEVDVVKVEWAGCGNHIKAIKVSDLISVCSSKSTLATARDVKQLVWGALSAEDQKLCGKSRNLRVFWMHDGQELTFCPCLQQNCNASPTLDELEAARRQVQDALKLPAPDLTSCCFQPVGHTNVLSVAMYSRLHVALADVAECKFDRKTLCNVYSNLDDDLKSCVSVAKLAASIDENALFHIPPTLKNNKEIAMICVKGNVSLISYVSDELQQDMDVFATAVSSCDYEDVVATIAAKHPKFLETLRTALKNRSFVLRLARNTDLPDEIKEQWNDDVGLRLAFLRHSLSNRNIDVYYCDVEDELDIIMGMYEETAMH